MTALLSKLNPLGPGRTETIKYLNAHEAQAIDDELMGAQGAFSLDQVGSLELIHRVNHANGGLSLLACVADGIGRALGCFSSRGDLPPGASVAFGCEWNQAEEIE